MFKKQNTTIPKMGEKLAKITEAIAEKENSRIEEKTYRRNCYEVFPFLTGTCCGGGGDGFGGLFDYKTSSYTNKN
ncbi:MAG: hypothetical protein RO469_10075 [Thermincola sp.]|jgi:hypothetical protein|nr:hypothetical protein [Thermincola sp.]MDT3703202.1 hypothetical protein [Thermincola sp.]